MPAVDMRFCGDGDDAWPDLQQKQEEGKLVVVDAPLGVAGLPNGMQSGATAVCIRVELPDGRIALAWTSLALLLTTADAMRARYGDPRNPPAPEPTPSRSAN